jgi:hypothetical protein
MISRGVLSSIRVRPIADLSAPNFDPSAAQLDSNPDAALRPSKIESEYDRRLRPELSVGGRAVMSAGLLLDKQG